MRYNFLSNLFLSTLVTSISCLALFANYIPPYTPKLCPSINTIKAATLISAEKAPWIGWIAKSPKNSFETKDEWVLVVHVGGEQDVLAQAKIIQSKLVRVIDKAPVKEGVLWMCRYSTDDNIQMYAWTVTPILSQDKSE